MKTYSTLITIIFVLTTLYINQCLAQTQSDSSDTYWEVVLPLPASQDIDMKQVLVGEVKDSLVSGFVRNTGTWKFSVDSIYFRGADALAFGLVSGFPQYVVASGDSHAGEFRFVPSRVGIHTAEIVIITQADTLIQNIRGEGIQPQLKVVADIIDFGIINVGSQKDTLQALTIKNIGTSPLSIIKTSHNKPNDYDFSTLAGSAPFTLNPGDTAKMDLRFSPSDVGRTSGVLEFHYNGVGSPAVVQLFGEGRFAGVASAELKANSLEAYPGDIIEVPIILSEQENLQLSGATSLKTDLSYNPTLLWAMDYTKQTIDATTAKITLANLPVNKAIGEPLALIRFKVGLGNAEECDLTLSNAEAVGGIADITLINGHFRLLGVCREGGTRLISPNSQTGMMKVSPNPTDGSISIEFSLSEQGYTEICIYNIMDEKVKTVFSENVSDYNKRQIDCEISDLGSGLYLIIFRTPTYNKSMQLMILK